MSGDDDKRDNVRPLVPGPIARPLHVGEGGRIEELELPRRPYEGRPQPTPEQIKEAQHRSETLARIRFARELVCRGRGVAEAFQLADAFGAEALRRYPHPTDPDEIEVYSRRGWD